MSKRISFYAFALIAAVFIAGCAGSSSYRKQVREEAAERVGLVNAQLTYDQAKRAFTVGKFEEALDSINAAIDRYESRPDFHVLKGRTYLETDRLEPALDAFLEALEHDEEFAEAHYYAGIVFQRWSENEQAHKHYMAAHELETDRVHYLLAAAESKIAIQKYDEARQMIEERLNYFEHNASLRHLLGQIALLQDDPAKAADLYAEARRLNPDDLMLMEELAYARFDAGQYARAYDVVRELRHAADEDELRTSWLQLEARCLVQLDRPAEARRLYLRLSRERQNDPVVWIELGTLAWQLGDFRRVADSSVRVISLAPERYEGYLLKGLNEAHRENHEEAVEQFREAARRAGDQPLPFLMLGKALEQAGRHDEAFDAYADALEVNPNTGEARNAISRLVEQGNVTVTQAPTSQ